jgi:hypothetical protein
MPNRNGTQHDPIIDDLRMTLPIELEKIDDDFYFIGDEGMMAGWADDGNCKGERPDLIILLKDEKPIWIEVGTYPKGKWDCVLNKVTLIQISHNKAVGLITKDPSEKTILVLNAIRKCLNTF